MIVSITRTMITVLSITAIILSCGCAKDVPTLPAELEIPWVEIESPQFKGTITSMAVGDDGTVYLGAYVQQTGIDPSILLVSWDGGESWTENQIGPFRISSLLIDNNDYLFATGDESRVWRSKDGGKAWETFELDFNDGYLYLFSFVGPNEEIVIWDPDDGMVISTDSGDSWESLVDTIPWNNTGSFSMTSDFRFFVVINEGLFFSEDTCTTWEGPVEGPWENYRIRQIDILEDDILMLLAGQLYLSYDFGETWDVITDEAGSIYRFWKDDMGRLYYFFDGSYDKRLMMSTDMGQSWTYQMEAIYNAREIDIGAGPSGEIYVSTGRGGPGFCRSMDGGTTWEFLGLAEGDPLAIYWGSDGHLNVCMPYSGIFRTDASDISWECFSDKRELLTSVYLAEKLNGELLAGTSYGILSSPSWDMEWAYLGNQRFNRGRITATIDVSGKGTFAGTSGRGVFSLPNGEDIWIDLGLHDYEITSLVMTDSLDFYASCSFGGVFHYNEESFFWDQMNEGLADLNVEALVLSPDGRLVAGTKYSGLYVMDPAEKIWRKLGTEELSIVAMEVYGGMIVIGTDYDGFYYYSPGMDGPEVIPVGEGGDIAGFGNYPYLTSMSIGPDGHIAFLSRERVFRSISPIVSIQ